MWINFKAIKDKKNHMSGKVWKEISYPFQLKNALLELRRNK